MRFSIWLENRLLTEGGKKKAPKPVQMPEPESNVVRPKRDPKQRIPKGRQNTTFNPRPKTRGSIERQALGEQ
jgi:hypothetical protein